jgi:hypothetical protein
MTDADIKVAKEAADQDRENDLRVEDVPNPCGLTEVTCGIVRSVVIFSHNIIIPLFAKILKFANLLFNQVFQFSVRDFSTYGKSAAVKFGWTLSRDLVNLSLIFILLYAAMRLILNIGGGSKRLVGGVIVVAILVNFSAFLTGIVIDASNIVADQFYSAAGGGGSNKQTAASQEKGVAPDIAAQLIKKTLTGVGNSKLLDQIKANKTDWIHILGTVFIQDVMKLPFFLITIVVLSAAALMFFVRMITLMFLLMLSPLAFLAYVLSKKYWDKWFSALTSNAIFAPAFFFMFSIAILTVSKGPLSNIGGTDGSTDFGFVSNLMYVIIVNGMMIASLLIARNFGAYGASGAVGLLNKGRGAIQSAAGRNTLGRLGRYGNKQLEKVSEWSENTASGRRTRRMANLLTLGAAGGLGRATREGLGSVANNKFGGSYSRQSVIDLAGTKAKDRANNPEELAGYMVGLNTATSQPELKKAYDSLSNRQRAELDVELRKTGQGDLADKLQKKLSSEDRDKVEKSRKESQEQTQNEQNVEELKKEIAKPDSPEKDDKIKTILSKISDKQVGELNPDEVLKIVTLLKGGQYKAVMDRKDLTPNQKDNLKQARFKKLTEAATANNEADVKAELDKMSEKDIAKLDKSILTNPTVIKNLGKGDLAKIYEEGMDRGTRFTIRDQIIRDPQKTDLQFWLNDDPVGKLF